MKRSKEEESGNIESLKCLAIEQTFDTLSLDKKRKLAMKLLKSAKIIHCMEIDPVESKFKKWICSGEKKFFTEEEVDKVWLIWNLIKKISTYVWIDHNRIDYYWISWKERDNKEFHVENYTNEESFETTTNKDEYFDWILENTKPEQVHLIENHYESEPFYVFPELTCMNSDRCPCNMEIDRILKFHEILDEDLYLRRLEEYKNLK